MEPSNFENTREDYTSISHKLWETALRPWDSPILPSSDSLAKARDSLSDSLPDKGLGLEQTRDHILRDIVPGLNAASLSPNYYGFVTGGTTPAALLADHIASVYDQNVQVHLPEHSVATDVEYKALGLLTDLLRLDRAEWLHGTFTTGATGSNLIGLACGREFILREAARRRGIAIGSVGEYGLSQVMQEAGVKRIKVLSTMPHSSLGKAASIVGIGRANLKCICTSKENPLAIDMDYLACELSQPGDASIVVISCGEVNTGHFATTGKKQMLRLRELCDKYGAWLHVDGAFGIYGRMLDVTDSEFAAVVRGCEGLELADSITADAHKFLNVPYDCGIFLCRHPSMTLAADVFRNSNAVYLSSGAAAEIPSPLNIGIENSRRFRALPVYASLLAYGREGYKTLLEAQIRLARKINGWLFNHPAYEALPEARSKDELCEKTGIIVLFRARDEQLNRELTSRINATSKIFVSGSSWEGRPACRIAVSNWKVNVERDFALVAEVLDEVIRTWDASHI